MNTMKNLKVIPGVKYKAVLSNRIYLTRTKELHDYLVEKLTYILPPKQLGRPNEYYCDVTRINDNILTIPIGRTDLIPEFYDIEDKRITVSVDFPKFKFDLRESQQIVVDELTDSCLINANPSWGKTFCAIAIACKLKQKTLVIVHTANLRKQWVAEVQKTLGIEAGEIGGGKNNNKGPIVIATMQTLKNILPDVIGTYGTVIVDEVHHIVATVFKKIVDASRARYKIGLSATLWRKDGKHVMFHDYTGARLFSPKDENKVESEIIIVNSGIRFSTDANKPWAIRVNELMQNTDYMNLVLNLSKAQVDRGHKVLTVGNRVEFLETCGSHLDSFQVIAGKSSQDVVDLDKYDGIFASGNIFSEGVNYPPLSSLIMAYPINNRALLKQLIGRIERVHEGKLTPEAIDISLDGRTAKAQLAQRLNFYVTEGYKLRYI